MLQGNAAEGESGAHFLDFLGDSQDAAFNFLTVHGHGSQAEREEGPPVAASQEVAQVIGEGGASLSGWLWPPAGADGDLDASRMQSATAQDHDRESFADQLPPGRSRSSTPESTRAAARTQMLGSHATAAAPAAAGRAASPFQMMPTTVQDEDVVAAASARRPLSELPQPPPPRSSTREPRGDGSGSSARTHLVYDPTPLSSDTSERGDLMPQSASVAGGHAMEGATLAAAQLDNAGNAPPLRLNMVPRARLARPSFAERLMGRLLANVPALPANAAELPPGAPRGPHRAMRGFVSAPELLLTKPRGERVGPPWEQENHLPAVEADGDDDASLTRSTATTESSASSDLTDTAVSTERLQYSSGALLTSQVPPQEGSLKWRAHAAKRAAPEGPPHERERGGAGTPRATVWLQQLGRGLSVCSVVGLLGMVCCFSWVFSTVL